MLKSCIAGAAVLVLFSAIPAIAGKSVYCNSNGSAYLVDTAESGTVMISFTGSCMGGVWHVPIEVVAAGSEGEADWGANRFNRLAFDLVRQVPDRPLVWSVPSKGIAAGIARAKPAPALRLKPSRLPDHAVRMLAAPAG
jgi:hypothetical protein